MKKLIFLYNWIGPRGPLRNNKAPDLYEIASCLNDVTVDESLVRLGQRCLYLDLKPYASSKLTVMPTSEIDTIGDSPFLYEIQLNVDRMEDEFSEEIGILDRLNLDHRLHEKLLNKQGYLFLTTIFESFFEDSTLLSIHRYFTRKGIPLDRIIYFTNCINGQEIYVEFCKKYKLEPLMRCEYIGLYLIQQIKEFYKNRNQYLTSSVQKKENLFLNLNRRTRPHRYAFLLKLVESNLLSNFDISFDKPDTVQNFLRHSLEIKEQYGIKNLTNEKLVKLYTELPYVLDTPNFNKFPMESDVLDTMYLYHKTYVSVVSETNFESDVVHITEKTIKPILFKHPFIMVGPVNSLKYMRSLGFKTFSDFWDESYDSCSDYRERMNKIIDVIKEISSWSPEKLQEFENQVKPIVNFNLINLFKLRSFERLNMFVNKYGADL